MDGHMVVLPKFEFLWLSDFVTSFRDRALGTAKSCKYLNQVLAMVAKRLRLPPITNRPIGSESEIFSQSPHHSSFQIVYITFEMMPPSTFRIQRDHLHLRITVKREYRSKCLRLCLHIQKDTARVKEKNEREDHLYLAGPDSVEGAEERSTRSRREARISQYR
jgi:hypothetical protein